MDEAQTMWRRLVPGYSQALSDIRNAFSHAWEKNESLSTWGPAHFIETARTYGVVRTDDFWAIALLAVSWTVLRYAATYLIFQPYGRWVQLQQAEAKKFPESAFKCIVYAFLWSWTSYTIFAHPEFSHIFYDPSTVFDDWSYGMEVAPVLYWLYMAELAFYAHSVYGTLFMDQWRKDSVVMLFHHFLTMALIGFSYALRFHKIGVLVIFVHDITDIIMEFTKCQVYLKTRGGTYHWFNDALSTVGFIGFAIAWYVFRLYWYPIKALHASAHGLNRLDLRTGECPFFFFFNIMLWILLMLNIYWFMFIMNFLYKVVTGQLKSVDDIREEDVQEKIQATTNRSDLPKQEVPGVLKSAGTFVNGSAGDGDHHRVSRRPKKQQRKDI